MTNRAPLLVSRRQGPTGWVDLRGGVPIGGNNIPASPVAGYTQPIWSEDFSGTSLSSTFWTVQDHTTRSYEQSVSLASNVQLINGIMTGSCAKLSSPVNSMNYSGFYIDSIGKRGVHKGQYIEWKMLTPLKLNQSAGLWPGFVWLRQQNGGIEIDAGEGWGSPNSQSGLSSSVDHRLVFTLWQNTSGTGTKAAGFIGPNTGDLTQWVTHGILVAPDGAITFYRNRVPFAPTGGAFPGTTAPVSTYPWLAIADSDYYNLRINLQVGNSFYGNPDVNTDWSTQFLLDYIVVWGKDP